MTFLQNKPVNYFLIYKALNVDLSDKFKAAYKNKDNDKI